MSQRSIIIRGGVTTGGERAQKYGDVAAGLDDLFTEQDSVLQGMIAITLLDQ